MQCRKVKTDLSNLVKHGSHLDTKKQKNGGLAEKGELHFSHFAPLAVQAQQNCFIILSPISVPELGLWIPQTTEIGVLKEL